MTCICVTGATSYIGSHIISRLLSHTQSVVRATTRKVSHPNLAPLTAHPRASDLLLFVADLSSIEPFKSIFAGCDVVIHTATPVMISWEGENPFSSYEEYEEKQLKPAVTGVRELLHIAHEAGVKRFVLTGSLAAVMAHEKPPEVLHEGIWSDEKMLKENLMNVPDFGYYLAKIRQEREAIQVAKQLNLELVVLFPAFVFGPTTTGKPQSLMHRVLSMITGKGAGMIRCEEGNLPDWSVPLVDVRDVAEAHVKAALKEGKPEDRYLLVSEHKHCEDMHEIAKKIVPEKVCKDVVEWKTDEEKGGRKKMTIANYSNKRMKELLGREPIAWETTIGDTIRQMEENGHL